MFGNTSTNGNSGYHRVRRSYRPTVYRIVHEHPGITFSEVMRVAGIGNGTTSYHLSHLERDGEIVSRSSGRRRMYWTANYTGLRKASHYPPVTRDIISILQNGDRIRGRSVSEIARLLGYSHQRVSYNLKNLEAQGLVRRRKQGRTTMCTVRTYIKVD